MCRRVLLVVLWLRIGTRLRLLAVELLSIAGPLCPSQCLFETILVIQCLEWHWWVFRAEPMLLCWPDLLYLVLSPTIFSFSSFHGLVLWGWGIRIDRVCSLSPSLSLLTHF